MFKIPPHQVAGHHASNGTLGPLVDDSGRFYKPLQGDERGSAEVTFYKQFSTNTEIPDRIRRFFPVFYGTQVMKASDGFEHPHIMLQDLASSRSNPTIMDIKIGSRTFGPEASDDYIEKCLKRDRETTTLRLGFRISGLQVYVSEELGFYKPSRDLVLKSSIDDVKLLFRRFVSSNSSGSDPDYALASKVYGGPNGILAQLLELKTWFEDQTIYHFCACSLLFMFEKTMASKGETSNAQVKLIDFAHVTEGRGVIDHNFLGGLCSLIKFISEVLKDPEDHKTPGGDTLESTILVNNGH
ncbi:inositol polyphosphate multikinase alpha-like [Cynara cardunculus var. scolymus]|uniref:Inositol polyphosphate multikinase n=1 Tax=Cynara cardunculus var. scolymus TaxID=59895 RepID=A0A103XWF9_CYNCS|nr:inositol polyphosphate multikinase alpha-like [Cynara cardunculus var. scolymus]KVH98071.1 Inositol polyphosphate kinase [Cynara cardunculus var. scolymus]